MDSHDEKFIPDNVDEQEERHYQTLDHAVRRPTCGRFIDSAEQADQADIRSLDRVWERLVEHVASNSTAYETNRNVLGFRKNNTTPDVWRDREAFRKRSAFYHSLSTIVAVCILALLVGSMVIVLHAARQAGSSQGASGQGQVTPISGKEQTPLKAQISLVQGKNGIEFNPQGAKLIAGGVVVWNNQTNTFQAIVSDSKAIKDITLAPGGSASMPFPQAGSYVFQLASGAKIAIEVVDAPPVPGNAIAIVPSKVGIGAIFVPTALKLAVGSTIIWINNTDQIQVIVSDSAAQNFKLGPKMATKMRLDKPGSYNWFLESDPTVQVTIVVGHS